MGRLKRSLAEYEGGDEYYEGGVVSEGESEERAREFANECRGEGKDRAKEYKEWNGPVEVDLPSYE